LKNEIERQQESYEETNDRSLIANKELVERWENPNPLFRAGQSHRVWGELYNVIDSSDVILEVLDARDPMGTRCRHVEEFLKREKPHKHLVLVLNKVDLVSTWITVFYILLQDEQYKPRF
jgi:nuclear GTP-binding protein